MIDSRSQNSYNYAMKANTYNIVIVDNDEQNTEHLYACAARDERFSVTKTFGDCFLALEYLKENNADLLFVGLDAKEGEKLLVELLKSEIDIDVIAMSAQNNGKMLAQALHLGAADYLLKPITDECFARALDEYAERMRVFRGLKSADQEAVDHLLHFTASRFTDVKSGKTADVMNCFLEYPQRDFTVKDIAERLALSDVTVRRYLKRLTDAGRVVSDIDYGTGGHPRIVYRLP
ncbi:MAG: response regulator [Christensenella sp.]